VIYCSASHHWARLQKEVVNVYDYFLRQGDLCYNPQIGEQEVNAKFSIGCKRRHAAKLKTAFLLSTVNIVLACLLAHYQLQ